MSSIPVYLKTESEMPRPEAPEFYWVTRDGTFLCRNHPFFSSDTPTARAPRALAEHKPFCQVRYPKLSRAALEHVIGFFSRVFEMHGAEAVILLYWDLERKRYRLWAPKQEAGVWESRGGYRTPMDVTYKVPMPPPPRHLLVGDIHCHCDLDAYASYTDRHDEIYRDGIHVVVGKIDREPPDFHLEAVIDGFRFPLEFDQFFRGYQKRRLSIPPRWLEQVKVSLKQFGTPSWKSGNYSYGGYHGN